MFEEDYDDDWFDRNNIDDTAEFDCIVTVKAKTDMGRIVEDSFSHTIECKCLLDSDDSGSFAVPDDNYLDDTVEDFKNDIKTFDFYIDEYFEDLKENEQIIEILSVDVSF